MNNAVKSPEKHTAIDLRVAVLAILFFVLIA